MSGRYRFSQYQVTQASLRAPTKKKLAIPSTPALRLASVASLISPRRFPTGFKSPRFARRGALAGQIALELKIVVTCLLLARLCLPNPLPRFLPSSLFEIPWRSQAACSLSHDSTEAKPYKVDPWPRLPATCIRSGGSLVQF